MRVSVSSLPTTDVFWSVYDYLPRSHDVHLVSTGSRETTAFGLAYPTHRHLVCLSTSTYRIKVPRSGIIHLSIAKISTHSNVRLLLSLPTYWKYLQIPTQMKVSQAQSFDSMVGKSIYAKIHLLTYTE